MGGRPKLVSSTSKAAGGSSKLFMSDGKRTRDPVTKQKADFVRARESSNQDRPNDRRHVA